MELIKITKNEKGEQLVSARELHKFLEVKSRFNDWFKNRVRTYELLDGIDFLTVTKNLVTGGKEKDGILKMEVAKELSMVENNEKGREARRYFILAEKKLKQLPQLSEMEMISKIAANYVKQDKRIEVLEFKVKNKITLNSGQQSKIKQAVNKKVMERWELNLNINIGTYLISTAEDRKLKSKLFRNLYKNLYQKFGVPSYRDIKEGEYDLALSFINTWIEDSEVRNG